MIEVLHLTAHLGGGVGKALAMLAAAARRSGSPVRHVIACLEQPAKTQFVDQIRASGVEVLVRPSVVCLQERVAAADVIQLEWWNHPATIAALAGLGGQPMRLLAWCHVSGLGNPAIPAGLLDHAHRVVFTSPCSLQAPAVSTHRRHARFSVIASAGGLDAVPQPRAPARPTGTFSAGYLGSLNFAKLHPDFVHYVSSVRLAGFRVRMIGDDTNRQVLAAQCAALGNAALLDFRGYATDVAAELASVDALAYLLNPGHYGTAENALVEAMAMGVVPVVLDNPAERCIVRHGDTGLVVGSPAEFAQAMQWLHDNPAQRQDMGQRASRDVRARFRDSDAEAAFRAHYLDLMDAPRLPLQFTEIFGETPDAWFLACQPEPDRFCSAGQVILPEDPAARHALFEKSKGSVFHFRDHFPRDERLAGWAGHLAAMTAAAPPPAPRDALAQAHA